MTAMHRALAALLVLALPTPALAHNLDEYLQAATFAVNADHIQLKLSLTPGVDVSRRVLAEIDTDGNGRISGIEEQAYADQVRRDLSLTVDDQPLALRLASSLFPEPAAMKEGVGEILLVFEASVPLAGPERILVFENHHQRDISTYLENTILPKDGGLRVTDQHRTYEQSSYRLNYTIAPPAASSGWRRGLTWSGLVAAGLFAIFWRRKRVASDVA